MLQDASSQTDIKLPTGCCVSKLWISPIGSKTTEISSNYVRTFSTTTRMWYKVIFLSEIPVTM